MKKPTLFLCAICVLLSGCGNRNQKESEISDNSAFIENEPIDYNKVYFIDLEQRIKESKVDTFTINRLAKNITFTPLETTDKALLMTTHFKVIPTNERYYISSGTMGSFSGIMEFDVTGRYIDCLILKEGRGPKELPRIPEWAFNRNRQLLVASSLYEILVHSLENSTTNKYSLGDFFCYICVLNDGTMVGVPNVVAENGDTGTPYLHFRNQEGEIVKSLFYTQKRDITSPPEGRSPFETYHIFPVYSGDALFKDMFNDTIYRIRSMDEIKPYLIIHRGSLTLTPKDNSSRATIDQKVLILGLLETEKLIFIKYWHKEVSNCAIWDKRTQSFISNLNDTENNGSGPINRYSHSFTKYRTPNGKEILIAILDYFDGKLYSVLDAAQAMEFLPDIKEDDNPVLMVIELK